MQVTGHPKALTNRGRRGAVGVCYGGRLCYVSWQCGYITGAPLLRLVRRALCSGATWIRARLPRGLPRFFIEVLPESGAEVRVNKVPVNEFLDKGSDVIGTAVLIIQVICVLPDIHR